MSSVFIGYDYRIVDCGNYCGLDNRFWKRPQLLDDDDFSKITNGLNLLDQLLDWPELEGAAVVGFDAPYSIVEHMASTFGLSYLLSQPADNLVSTGFRLIGYDVVDLYTQETFLIDINTSCVRLNRHGLVEQRGLAEDFAKKVSGAYDYDVVGVWLRG